MCRVVVWPSFPEALWHHGHQRRTFKYTSIDGFRLKHTLGRALVPARGCMFFNIVGLQARCGCRHLPWRRRWAMILGSRPPQPR